MQTRSTSWCSRTSSDRLVWNGMPSSFAKQQASSSLRPQRAWTSKPSAFSNGTSTRAVLPVPNTPTPGNIAVPLSVTLCMTHRHPKSLWWLVCQCLLCLYTWERLPRKQMNRLLKFDDYKILSYNYCCFHKVLSWKNPYIDLRAEK